MECHCDGTCLVLSNGWLLIRYATHLIEVKGWNVHAVTWLHLLSIEVLNELSRVVGVKVWLEQIDGGLIWLEVQFQMVVFHLMVVGCLLGRHHFLSVDMRDHSNGDFTIDGAQDLIGPLIVSIVHEELALCHFKSVKFTILVIVLGEDDVCLDSILKLTSAVAHRHTNWLLRHLRQELALVAHDLLIFLLEAVPAEILMVVRRVSIHVDKCLQICDLLS